MRKIAAALAIACLLAGCKGKSLEGTWTASGSYNGHKANLTCVFSAPDKITSETAYPDDGWKATFVGTYSLDGAKLTTDYSDYVPVALSPEGDDLVKDQLNMKAKVLKEANKQGVEEITWEGDDAFTTRGPGGQNLTFTRSK